MEMTDATNQWGIELIYSPHDRNFLAGQLKPPFDPFIEVIINDKGEQLILHSTQFDNTTNPSDVYSTAKNLLQILYASLCMKNSIDKLYFNTVIERMVDNSLKRTTFFEPQSIINKPTFGTPTFICEGTIRNRIRPCSPPAPSEAQQIMRAATLNKGVESALQYLNGKPSWIELYKAYEALNRLPKGEISDKEIKLFTRTANTTARHHPNSKCHAPDAPMSIEDGEKLIRRWIKAASIDILQL